MDRTIFYLRNGWLTEEVAQIFGMYEDGEPIGDELGHLDSYVHKLQQYISELEAELWPEKQPPGMPQGFTFKIVACPDCGQQVADNWIVRHRKSGCREGTRTHNGS